jgi:hypothetical protein
MTTDELGDVLALAIAAFAVFFGIVIILVERLAV